MPSSSTGCARRKGADVRSLILLLLCVPILNVAVQKQASHETRDVGASQLATAAVLGQIDAQGHSATVKLMLHAKSDPPTPVYRKFVTYFSPGVAACLDLSTDRRWLAYDDPVFRIHVVNTVTRKKTVIGKGFRPTFSADGKYLAYLTADQYPVGTPGVQGFLRVYALGTGDGKSVGAGAKGYLYSDYAWSAQGHRLLWQINLLKGGAHQKRPNPAGPLWVGIASADRPAHVTVVHPPGRRGDLIRPGHPPDVRSDGGFSWAYGGSAVLYWRWRSSSNHGLVNRWALTRYRLPHGPAKTLALLSSSLPKDVGSVAPPLAARHGFVASLLPGSGNHPQLLRILDKWDHFSSVRLTASPIAGAFEPVGDRVAVVVGRPAKEGTFIQDVDIIKRGSESVKRISASLFARWTAAQRH